MNLGSGKDKISSCVKVNKNINVEYAIIEKFKRFCDSIFSEPTIDKEKWSIATRNNCRPSCSFISNVSPTIKEQLQAL